MGIWLGPMGRRTITISDITYSGNFLFTVDSNDPKKWEMAILDGTLADLVFLKNPGTIDIFMVAGGSSGDSGGAGNGYTGPNYGGAGGNGGECKTLHGVQLASNTNYKVTIGGSDGDTSFTGGGLAYTAVSGLGSSGGAGGLASAQGDAYDASRGSDGVYAFEEVSSTIITPGFINHKFGPGGGGAGGILTYYPYYYSYFADGKPGGMTNNAADPSVDGSGGAGAKSSQVSGNSGAPGLANHGQGGGGSAIWADSSNVSHWPSGGSGGSGIIFIRPHV